MKSKAWTEKFMQGVFLIAACTSVLAVALICIFLFANGVPAIREIGFVKLLPENCGDRTIICLESSR